MRRHLLLSSALVTLLGCPSGDVPGVDVDVVDAAGDEAPEVDAAEPACDDPDADGFGPGCDRGEVDCQPRDGRSFPGAEEQCGDRVDNDCDGSIDEACPCSEGLIEPCYGGEAATRGVGQCAGGFRQCVEGAWSGCVGERVPAEDRLCDGEDEDCDGTVDEGLTNACGLCGPDPLEACDDGFDNDCDGQVDEAGAGCTCDGRTRQPCYAGPPGTLGVGACRGGLFDCVEGSWTACDGEIGPAVEACDGVDNDCDGRVDEGLRNRCGVCGAPDPVELCDGVDNDCDRAVDEGLRLVCGLCPGEVGEEQCGNSIDDDCDSQIDERCPCVGGAACYPGPAETMGVGACQVGTRTCSPSGESWGPCTGFVLPSLEVCDGLDNNCDGIPDNDPYGCNVCGADAEACDDVDNDCDSLVDEGVRNGCGVCLDAVEPESECDGDDNDCDGLVDEGLTNACGTCGDSCYEARWDDPASFGEGETDGVIVDAAAGLRLGATRSVFPDLWVANSDDRTVSRINTTSATLVSTFDVGRDPSRTAVDFDGNVWIANRAFRNQGSVTKILARGCSGAECVAFTTPVGAVGDIPRGLAIDAEGYAWVGTFDGKQLFRIHPTTGEIAAQFDVPVSVYGLAIDAEGIIWIATMTDAGLAAFNTNTNRYVGSWAPSRCGSTYGVAVDGDGNVWAGSWRCNSLLRLDRTAFEAGRVVFDAYTHPTILETRGVAVDGTGAVYVAASGTNRLGKFDPATSTWLWTIPTCTTPIGVGVASDANIWVICQGSAEAIRYTPDGAELDTVTTGRGPYSYSDMTGFQLRNFTAPRGTWTVEFDCGFAACSVDRLRYEAAIPSGTSVAVRARTRADAASTWAEWSPAFNVSPAEVAGFLAPGRFAQVEVTLSTTSRSLSPVVSAVSIEWQRP